MNTTHFPDVEQISPGAHEKMVEALRALGATSEKLDATNEELMRPYAELSDQGKELARARVRSTIGVLREVGMPSGTDVTEIISRSQDRWVEAMRADGNTSEKIDATGEELILPFDQLSTGAQQFVSATVRGVVETIEALGGAVEEKAAG